MIAAFLILLMAVIPCTSPLLAQEEDSLRIMPLGDSITRGTGSSGLGGYREPLYYTYTIEGILFDFVGTLSDGEGFDTDHEGHGGKRADWLADSVGTFLDLENPDVILLHIGTNDISGGRDLQDVITDIESILDQAKNHNPLMTMMVAGIVPRRDDKDSLTTELNTLIRYLVEVKKFQGYDIKYVDHNSAFKSHPNWETELLYDTRHPNDDGYAIMAQVWADSLGLSPPIDSIPPATVTDLTIDQTDPAFVKLTWTAPGDDSTVGIASEYDIRYFTSMITEENFIDAYQATSEPLPSSSGNNEQFFVSGLQPGTEYYFAIKSRDEVPNESLISNIPSVVTTSDTTVFVDDFNREELGNRWVTSDSVRIQANEMASMYNSESNKWAVRAIYSYATNPVDVMFRYGRSNTEVENGSVGVMMLRNSLNLNSGRSYLIRYYNFAYHLYLLNNLNPPETELGIPVPEPESPQAGDLLRISYEQVGNENRFDVYLNEVYRGTLSDVDGILDPTTYYAGVAFENEVSSRLGEVDDFTIKGAAGNSPPHAFTLVFPEDADTLDAGQIAFVWFKSVDPDPQSIVNYEIYLDTDSLFPQGPLATGISDTFYVIDTDTFERGVYFWQVVAYDDFGDSTMSNDAFTFLFRDGSGVGDDVPGGSTVPRVASLLQNFPNPFNPLTVIRYDVPADDPNGNSEAPVPVRLRVYDARGRLARTLVDVDAPPGRYQVTWDGRDDRGVGLPSGTYIYMLTVGDERITRKMILIR